jgi:zinc D-Ala-D-Ala dipeptidase
MKPQLFYKIKIYCRVYTLATIAFCTNVEAQELEIVKKEKNYRQKIKEDTLKRMVELRSISPTLDYDLRYATKNNFTKQQLYKNGKSTFLRMPAANALKKVQEELAAKGYGLKIFDAYRPHSVTRKMWELIHDERYVANPSKGSGHNRGLSVDLTLVDLKTGKELDLGTGFDNFTDSAGHSFTNLPADVMQNRKLLKEVMEKHGFKPLQTEWWHYSWPNDRNYEVLDIDFKKLRK